MIFFIVVYLSFYSGQDVIISARQKYQFNLRNWKKIADVYLT